MSHSSSDDDEPLMKSPCESESDSDGDDNLFRYDRRRFIKSAPTKSTLENLSSPPRPKRKRRKPTTDDQMSLLEKNQEKKQKSLLARIEQTSVLHESDESIDGENMNNRGPYADPDSSIEILDDPGVMSESFAAKQSDTAVDLAADSSDEDDDVAKVRPGIQASDPLFERSRLARQQLKLAQLYHAEDVDVDSREVEAIVPLSTIKARLEDKDMASVEDLGKSLMLACMVKQEINGRSLAITKQQHSIKQNESIQKLVSKILLANSLPSSSRVKVTFDGVILEKHRTLAFYDIVDEDQVDVDIAANIAPKLNNDRNKSAHGQNLNLKLRRRVEKKVEEVQMQVGLREPFQHIVDTYCIQQNLLPERVTLHFEGEKLDLSKTPLFYDMESGELVDVNYSWGNKAG